MAAGFEHTLPLNSLKNPRVGGFKLHWAHTSTRVPRGLRRETPRPAPHNLQPMLSDSLRHSLNFVILTNQQMFFAACPWAKPQKHLGLQRTVDFLRFCLAANLPVEVFRPHRLHRPCAKHRGAQLGSELHRSPGVFENPKAS